MKKNIGITAVAILISTLPLVRAADAQSVTNHPLKLVVIGDSTVADYETSKSSLRGWGQMLPQGLKPGIRVVNLARNGRSTKSFLNDSRYAAALAEKADFILIQFGHNDSHGKDRPESTDAATDYKEFLARYIDVFRKAGTEPVFVTPMHRRLFDKDGKLSSELKPYADAMKDVAQKHNVPVIDLYSASGALLEKLGDAGSADLFGAKDRTHFVEKGARAMAKLVLEGIASQVPALSPFVALDALNTSNDWK